MNFNLQIKLFFSLCFLYFLSYCSGIGEDPPSVPIHIRSLDKGVCKINYMQEFKSYFVTEEASSNNKAPLNELNPYENRATKALNSLIDCIMETKNLIKNETFTKQELLNMLNEKFVKTEYTKPLIDNIIHPDYWNWNLLIKNRIIRLMELQQTEYPMTPEDGCYLSDEDNVLSKKEVDIFVKSLKALSKWLIKVEQRGDEFYEGFFKAENWLSRSKWEDNLVFTHNFITALSKHLREDSPEYSDFLNNLTKDQKTEAIKPLLAMAKWPPSFSQDLTPQNVKYIILNIHITKAMFSIYNINEDFVIDSKELKALSCLLVPILHIIMLDEIKKQPWETRFVAQWIPIFSTKNFANYLLQHQTIPNKAPFSYAFSTLMETIRIQPSELEPLDYTDVSRLVMVLFSKIFESSTFSSLPENKE